MAALSLVAGVAGAQEVTAEVLLRVAPAVVRIKADDEVVGSGFVYPTSKHITTSYTAINHHGDLTVVLADGKVVPARVIAWSEPHDLAILELGVAVKLAPLQLEMQRGFTGEKIALLGYPALTRPEKVEKPPRRDSPTPRFGTVSLVSSTQVNVDVDSWTGDDGAPIVTTAGRVLGVVSGNVERRLGTVDAASVTSIESIRARMGKYGEFEPKPPGDKGIFGGFYVSPWAAYHEVGAGLLTGWRYRWLAANIAMTFSHASFTPLNATQMRARWTFAYDVYVTANWRYARGSQLGFGPGVGLRSTFFALRENGKSVDLDPEAGADGGFAPLLVLQDIEGPFLFGVTWAPFAEAARLEVGIVFGRN